MVAPRVSSVRVATVAFLSSSADAPTFSSLISVCAAVGSSHDDNDNDDDDDDDDDDDKVPLTR